MQKKYKRTFVKLGKLNLNDSIFIRPFTENDTQFVYATWLNHYKDCSQFAKRIRDDIFYKNHHTIIEGLLGKSETTIAHPKDDTDTILGFLCRERKEIDPTIHFIFVKRAFRNMGIANALLSNTKFQFSDFTHWTNDCYWITEKYPDLKYNPYKLLGVK